MSENKQKSTSPAKQKSFQPKNNQPFEILFLGDTSFGENYQVERQERGGTNILEQFGYDYSLEKMKPLMQSADFVIANLETPITNLERSPYEDIKDYIHWTHVEKAPKTLLHHNVGLVSLANNHAYDFGEPGFSQTMEILNNHQMPAIGAGENLTEAAEPFLGEIDFGEKKFKFAVLAAFEEIPSYRRKYDVYAKENKPGLMPLDLDLLQAQIQRIKAKAPDTFIIFFPHWGSNYEWAEPEQREITDVLLSKGVDLVIGHGAHMIQEFEKRNNKWAIYSLGNFMFNSPGRYEKLKAPPYSFVAKMAVSLVNEEFNVSLKLYPIYTNNRQTNYQPRFLDEEEFYELSILLQRKKLSQETQYPNLKRKKDDYGYYIELPIKQNENAARQNNINWIGMMCRPLEVGPIEETMHLWMHRALVMEHELAQHQARLFCYSPLDIIPEKGIARGYVFENGQFRKMRMPIPRINYDWYIGSENEEDREGLPYEEFEPWAMAKGHEIYPAYPIRKLASDKLLTAEIISQLDKSYVPVTEFFKAEKAQLNKFLESYQAVFIKPQYGSMGNGIFVIKKQESGYLLEFYDDGEKISSSAKGLNECLEFIKKNAYSRNNIIQEAINGLRVDGNVFDVRVIMIHDGQSWHMLSQIRVGAAGKELSNLSQGGECYTTQEILGKALPAQRLAPVLEKINVVSTKIANLLKEKYGESFDEIALDLMIDRQENIVLAELNVKPGTEGYPENFADFFNMTEDEKSIYENLSLKHGKYLANALLSRAKEAKSKSLHTSNTSISHKSSKTKRMSKAKPTKSNQKYIGFICRDRNVQNLEKRFYSWMHRPFLLDQALSKYGYKLLCYSPWHVNPETGEVTGYILENNWYKKITVEIPTVNYDYFQGPSRSQKGGLTYPEFHEYAAENGYEIYPCFSIRQFSRDKLHSLQTVAEFNPSVIPHTELFTGEIAQLERLLQAYGRLFIKPRFGSQGEKILVLKDEGSEYLVDFYTNFEKKSTRFNTLTESLFFMNEKADGEDYIVQQAIDVITREGSVFDVRALMFYYDNKFNFVGEMRQGGKDKEISNINQGGNSLVPLEGLSALYSPQKAPALLEKIKKTGMDVADFLNKKHGGEVNEIAYDIIFDKAQNVYIAEINVPPGLPSQPEIVFNMTDAEKKCYESTTLKYVESLAKSLVERCDNKKILHSSVWFDDIQQELIIDEKDSEKLVELISEAFANKTRIQVLPEALHFDTEPRIVFISGSNGSERAKVVMGQGIGLLAALNSAIELFIKRHPKLNCKSIKLDIVQDVKTIKDHVLRNPLQYERSLYGFAFEKEFPIAYLPEEVVAHTYVNSSQEINYARIVKQAKVSSEMMDKLKKRDSLTFHIFKLQSYYKGENGKFSLYRGHRLYEQLNPELLLSSAIAAGDYLVGAVKSNGDFRYEYLPKKDAESDKYNILRHAGSIYAMLELYEVTQKPALLEASTIALKSLMQRAMPVYTDNETLLCIVENDAAKLGANGLTLLVLSKYMRITMDKSYLLEARKLAKWMQTLQKETGEFFPHKLSYATKQGSDFVSMYYPGEAIFSLVRFYEVDPDETWLDMAQKAADFIIHVRDKGKKISELEHDHWLLYGLNELHQRRPSAHYLEQTQKICQAIIKSQHRDPAQIDWLGGFYNPPRSTPVACRSEGMGAAYQLLLNANFVKDASVLWEAITLGIRFQLQTQFTPEKAMYLAKPQRTLGGFSASLTDYSIRIDYVQHNLSSIIAFYRLLNERKQPSLSDVLQSPKIATSDIKWMGMICNIKKPPKWQPRQIYPWMFRQYVLDKFLADYNYKIITFSPSGIDAENQTITGYSLEDGVFNQITVPIPKVTYDFHMGKSIKGDAGLTRDGFQRWAQDYGYEIYPIKAIRNLAGDKLETAQLIAEYDKTLVPYTERFTGEIAQVEKFLENDDWIFIKPRFGSKGNGIFVIREKSSHYEIEFYNMEQKIIERFSTLKGCLSFIKEHADDDEDYIIQQAIRVKPFQDSVFDIRTIVFKEREKWHFLTELVVGKSGNAVSNLYQGGQNYDTETFLRRLFSESEAEQILDKIKKISIDVAKMIDQRYNNQVNEISFDLLLDADLNLFVSEINVKPGLAGEPTEYEKLADMTEEEQALYEKVTLKHGEYLVKSLIARAV